MDKKAFVATYINNFMAAWAANNYDDACMRGEHEKFWDPNMIKEAETMGESVWENMPDKCKEKPEDSGPWIAP